MHQVGAADAASHGQRPGERPRRGDAVLARLNDLDDLAGPIPVVAVVRFVEHHAHEFARQGDADVDHASVEMTDAPALIGVPFDANRCFHAACSLTPDTGLAALRPV